MDALLPAFVVAALAEMGDATQLLAALLGARFRRPVAVLAGILVAAAANAGLSSAAGIAVAHAVPHAAMRLLVAVALAFAGVGALLRARTPAPVDRWRLGAFASSAGAFLILAFGDKTQFVTAAIAGAGAHPVLIAVGAAAGVVAADTPAVLLGAAWPGAIPVGRVGTGVGVVLLLAAAVVAIAALGIG